MLNKELRTSKCPLYSMNPSLGLVTDDSFAFPLTQQHIADALGLSLVHTNKTLARLRRRGMFSQVNGTMILTNPRMLECVAQYFDEDVPQRLLI
jgi:CRP-like cAMP-binding protein